ncbi:restriction endonuclease [Elizabethkingia anophelis]|nr:restriction endonuclease [Elizabethkingia anophelis]
MKYVNLNEIIIELESGSREKGGSISSGILSIGAKHLSADGTFNLNKKEYVSEKYYKKMKSGRIKPYDILIVKDGATTGKTVFVEEDFPFKDAVINEHVFRVKINDKYANPKYIFYFLNSFSGQKQILSDFRGATVGGISRGFIYKVNIPLNPLEDQNKIVSILDKINTILNKRQETIFKYDELLRAIFLDMFGNPMERPNQWRLDTIGKSLTNLSSGISYSGEENKLLEDDELGVLKISAVTKGFFNSSEFKAVKKDIIKRQTIHPQKGDLLFSRANTLELVGATCIVDANYDNLFLPDKIWKVETDESTIKKTYLHYVLQNKDVRKSFLSIATGSSGSMLNISMDKFRNIIIPYPPIELQEQFEDTYLKYTKLKEILKKSHHYISELFVSISQLAFKGELNFNTAVNLEVLLENNYEFFTKNSNQETIRLLLKRLDKDELNNDKFYTPELYDKAKEFVFQLLKEQKIRQYFDTQSKSIKLII